MIFEEYFRDFAHELAVQYYGEERSPETYENDEYFLDYCKRQFEKEKGDE